MDIIILKVNIHIKEYNNLHVNIHNIEQFHKLFPLNLFYKVMKIFLKNILLMLDPLQHV